MHLLRFFLCLVIPALLSGLPGIAAARSFDLTIDHTPETVDGRSRPGVSVNGSLPGPVLRWKEGEDVELRVVNHLSEPTSIHWHGMILPFTMDGVPGISFPGIAPGASFTYRFKAVQSGTYWYHGHSGFQEQEGLYGGIVIEPRTPTEPAADRDYLVLLTDWTDQNPDRIMARLKKQSDYYNLQQRTVVDFFRDIRRDGFGKTLSDRMAWGDMRMDPTDIADVTGSTYTFLMNGQSPRQNWTALFRPGERVRLRFVNGSAMTHFDVSIPGLSLRIVQADGQDVEPVTVDGFRIAVAETYDAIVEPKDDRVYTLFAAAMDRSGYARGTLAVRAGQAGPIPALGPRPLVSLEQMAAAHGGAHGGHGGHSAPPGAGATGHQGHAEAPAPASQAAPHHQAETATPSMGHSTMPGMDHAAMAGMDHSGMSTMDHAAIGHAMPAEPPVPAPATWNGTLAYRMLRSASHHHDWRPPDREIVLRLTGDMNRYIWSFDDKKFAEAGPIRLRLGERVRFTYVNQTMMNHPIHLHGMWQDIDLGLGPFNPRKHVVNVAPGETVRVEVTADAPGQWAFHCHLLYHMASGMFRKVIVEAPAAGPAPAHVH